MDPGCGALSCRAKRDSLVPALRSPDENAVRHTWTGSIISRSWRRNGEGRVLVAFEDAGPDTPEEEMRGVCERLFSGRHRSSTGTGLGLAIVEFAVERRGSRLHFAIRRDGRPPGRHRASRVIGHRSNAARMLE